jgi:F-box protein 11
MSYARFNDEHDDGQLSEFRARLAGEVRAQTGRRDFVIFQDREDVLWGQNWERRIDETLDAVTLLVAVITPGFFASSKCRDEVARFRERERYLGRDDLILQLYYISAREMDDPLVRESDELSRVLASRQLADWRDLRFESFTSPQVRKSMAQLASRMRDTFWHPQSLPARPADTGRRRTGTTGATAPTEQLGSTARVTAKTEPPTHVVDLWQRGDFTSVSEAIEAARPGDRIVIRPGLYQENLVVDKPLEILGDGPLEEIVIRARDANALLFRASIGRVANLTLRQAGGDGGWCGVDITQGRLDLEGCDISSRGVAGVAIRNGADPRLRRNRIHDGKESGVLVQDDGMGTLEDNDIFANTYSNVEIRTGGNPVLRRNQIHDGKVCGVLVQDNGMGTFEDNDISGNTTCGVEIRSGGNPTMRHNRLNRNDYVGIRIYDGGRGVLEDNDLTGNKYGAWNITDDCKAGVIRARNKE